MYDFTFFKPIIFLNSVHFPWTYCNWATNEEVIVTIPSRTMFTYCRFFCFF